MTFVVDITKLNHPDDVKKYFFSKWNHSGSHPLLFVAQFGTESHVEVERCAPGASGKYVFYLYRLHSVHPFNPEFHRMLGFVSGMSIYCTVEFVFFTYLC